MVTGAINDPRFGEKVNRPAFQRLYEKACAIIASSVSANTDLLITGAEVGASKLAKAEKLGVEIADQGEIWRQPVDAGIAWPLRHEYAVMRGCRLANRGIRFFEHALQVTRRGR